MDDNYTMLTLTWVFLSVLCTTSCCSSPLNVSELVIIILSQRNEYHHDLALDSKDAILDQARKLYGKESPYVHLSHEDFPHIGDWTVIPLIPAIDQVYGDRSAWILFAEDQTEIKLDALMDVLRNYNKSEEQFIGFTLEDANPTIIHHFFMEDDVQYPNFATGFAITTKLLKRLAARLDSLKRTADFSIDPAHELALFIWDDGRGETLQHEPAFCVEDRAGCATKAKPFRACDDPLPNESVYFAVKTCSRFHRDRVPVVKSTWGAHAKLLRFFSDGEDDAIPTVVQNLSNAKDLCLKTMDIVRRVAAEIRNLPDVKWVVIADDDTILSVDRLRQLLTCYDSWTPVALGERYGYNVYSSQGYNYITMGGGMAFSRNLIERLAKPGACVCPKQQQPDDMYIGICLAMMGVELTHSPLFHQGKPNDYARSLLESQSNIVSFHRFWNMGDAKNIYDRWLSDELRFCINVLYKV